MKSLKSKKWIALFLVISMIGNLSIGFSVNASESSIETEETNDVEIDTDNELKQDDEKLDEDDILQEGDELTEIEEEITDTEIVDTDTIDTETADDSSEGTGQAQTNNISLNSVDAEQNVSLVANAENIASGVIDEVYGQITWEIDNSGKLTVTGTGDAISPNSVGFFPWDDYHESITSAVISVTGMTTSAAMFSNCWNMTQIDLSNFDTSQITNMGGMFQGCSSLTALDLRNFNTSNVTNMNAMFADCSNLKELDLSSFDTSKVTGMSSMFMRCSSLESVDLKSFNTNNVTAMQQMFYECSSLKELDLSNFSTRNVTFMRQMFQDCGSLISLNVSSFNTSYVTDMSSLFAGCSSLTSLDVSNFDTSAVENMSYMFYGSKSLTSLDLSEFVTNKVQSMGGMFCDCEGLTDLDISSFNTSTVTDMSGMFQNCKSVTSLDLHDFDTSNVSSMEEMFLGCESLTGLDLSNFVTSQVWCMNLMFFNCKNMETLDVSNFDTSNVSGIGGMFYGCSSLKTLDLNSFDLSNIVEFDESYDGAMWDDHREDAVYASLMFGECNNLEVINCPINVSLPITLPGSDGDVWKQNDETVITELPKNLSNSITITKNDASAETGYAQIISLTPENGAQDVGFDASNVPYFQITFDRDIIGSETNNNVTFADLNFDAGTIKIFQASNDELVYEVTYDDWMNEMYDISGTTSSDISVISETTLQLDPLNAYALFESDTKYYITVDESFIQFSDGSVNSTIEKNEWGFKTDVTHINNELDFTTDVWKFRNFSHDNCESYMGNEYLNALLYNLTPSDSAKVMSALSYYGSGGHCQGMSISVILNKVGGENIPELVGVENLREVDKEDAIPMICYYQVTQALRAWKVQEQTYMSYPVEEQLSILSNAASKVKDGGCPVLFAFGGYDDENLGWSAHAVVAYAVEEGNFVSSSTQRSYDHRILLYDCNVVNWSEDNCLLFNEGTDEWEIPYYEWSRSTEASSYLKACSYTIGDIDVKNRVDSMNGYKAEIESKISSSWLLKKAGTEEVWTVNGLTGEITGPSELVHYSDSESTFGNTGLNIVLPDATSIYECIPESGNKENLSFDILYNNLYLSVNSASASKATLDPSGIVSIDGNMGNFSITIASDITKNGEFHTYTVSGSTDGNVSVALEEGKISIKGDDLEGVQVIASDNNVSDSKTIIDSNSVEYGRSKDELILLTSGDSDNDDASTTNGNSGNVDMSNDTTTNTGNKTSGTSTTRTVESANTGDKTSILSYIVIILLSCFMLVLLFVNRKKLKSKDWHSR